LRRLFLLPLFLLILLIPAFLVINREIFSSRKVNLEIRVDRGESLKEVTERLKEFNVVEHPQLLYYWGRLKGIQIKAGCYRISGVKSPTEILEELTKGSPCLRKFTVPPGSDVFILDSLMSKSGICRKGEVLKLSKSKEFLRKLEVPSLDGYMFPDTYYINESSDCKQVIEVTVKRMKEELSKLMRNYTPPEKVRRALKEIDKNKVLTVASIVEKETSISEEKPLISAVIYNRLIRRMKVQCDPTVIYSLELKGIFKKNLTYKDLEVKSPFNTYIVGGLPPHPICNPSLESIKAALYPANVDYLYFVANGEGGHVFSRMYNQHLKNVRKFRKKWQRRRDL